ncbi:MAG: ATP synthase subunit C [Clostridiales bacterium]|nr:ATP synthase subunit C [Clostridiales bacterium]
MSNFIYAAIVILPAAALGYLAYRAFKSRMNGVSTKKILKKNLLGFAVVLAITSTLMFSVSAAETADDGVSADTAAEEVQDAEETEETSSGDNSKGLGLLAAGLVTGLAGIGGGIAVAAGAPAAIAAASEDPKSFGRSLIFVALGESIALYGVVISILILNQL